MDIEINQKADSDDGRQWQIKRAEMHSLNSKMHVRGNSKFLKQRNKNLRNYGKGNSKWARIICSVGGFCWGNMEPAGGNNGQIANPNAPVFFTMGFTSPEGKKPEKGCRHEWCKGIKQDRERLKGKGKADGSDLKGVARRWAGMDGVGKATNDEGAQPLYHTMEEYQEEREGKSIFGERD